MHGKNLTSYPHPADSHQTCFDNSNVKALIGKWERKKASGCGRSKGRRLLGPDPYKSSLSKEPGICSTCQKANEKVADTHDWPDQPS